MCQLNGFKNMPGEKISLSKLMWRWLFNNAKIESVKDQMVTM